ncbi:MAG: EAL domain-containing protein [Oceanospirillaceae bacterium]
MTLFSGQQLIRDIAKRNVTSCTLTLSIKDAAKFMHSRRCSSIVIVDDGFPVGIWTETEALKLNYSKNKEINRPINSVMNDQICTVDAGLEVSQAALKFKIFNTSHLIVLNPDRTMFGIISQSDMVVNQDANNFLTIAELGAVKSANTPFMDSETSISGIVDNMRRFQCDALIISCKGLPQGIVTTRDIVRAISLSQTQNAVSSIMSRSLITAPASMNLLAARSLMVEKHIRHIVVENEQGLAYKLISFSDILANIDHSYSARLHASLEHKELKLQVAERHLHLANAVINASSDGIMMTDEKGIIVAINPAYTSLTGYSYEEAIGQPSTLTSSGKHNAQFYQDMWREMAEKGVWQGEIWNRKKNGEIYPEWLTINKVLEPYTGEIMYSGVFSDVSEAKKSKETIENLAYYDPLTELPNRQLLHDRLDVAINLSHEEEYKLAVLLVDLDNFKQINDSLGHIIGDRVLKEVALRLNNSITPGRTLARIGGDEFMVFFNYQNVNQVSDKAQRLLDSLKIPVQVNDSKFLLTLSIGCALYPSDGENQTDLIKNAETAMYRAKAQGRNRFCMYSPDMNAQYKERLLMEYQLRQALKNQEFHLLYQPKVCLKRDKIVGVEALIRWNSPVLGHILPDQFIYLAENLGLIPDIGHWVIREAIEQAALWQTLAEEPIVISVNVSAKQFIKCQLVDQVKQALRYFNLDPKLLDIEVTESCLIDNLSLACENLQTLRALGVQVSLDDFGTGYSSLSKLNQLPLDTLKIDRSFINEVPGKQGSQAVVSTIIFLAHQLNLKVVAEGVENSEQKQFLKKLNCEQMQGYYFSKPVQTECISAMLEAQKNTS